MTIKSDALSEADLAVAEILLEMSAERDSPTLELQEREFDEVLCRLARKGFTPSDPIN